MFNIIMSYSVFTILYRTCTHQFVKVKIFVSTKYDITRTYCFALSRTVQQLTNNFEVSDSPTRTDVSSSSDSCLSTKCENFTPRLVVAPSFPFSPSVPVVAEDSHLKTPLSRIGGAWLTQIPAQLCIGIRGRRGKTR